MAERIRSILGSWLVETRADGLYVLVEEVGGQGELGPFHDLDAARQGLIAYLGSGPEPGSGRDRIGRESEPDWGTDRRGE